MVSNENTSAFWKADLPMQNEAGCMILSPLPSTDFRGAGSQSCMHISCEQGREQQHPCHKQNNASPLWEQTSFSSRGALFLFARCMARPIFGERSVRVLAHCAPCAVRRAVGMHGAGHWPSECCLMPSIRIAAFKFHRF